jgi:hypothetical protein
LDEEVIKNNKLKKENVEKVTVIAFIFVMKKFFDEGYEGIVKTVDTLKDLGVDGFYLGKTFYQGRNENVVLGKNLSDELFESITDESAKSIVLESEKLWEVVERCKGIVIDA